MIGNFWPDKVSFLPAMRYYAGNWATSQWLFRKDTGAEEKLDTQVKKAAPIVVEQLTRLYDRDTAELLLDKGLAFRSMHSHGRALNGLISRAVDDVEDYHVREGELISGVVNGWNFGDGHLHDDQLLAGGAGAVRLRRGRGAGRDARVAAGSHAAPALPDLRRRHGLIEEGWVNVADMVARLPWLDERGTFPVEVVGAKARPAPGAPSIA